MKVRKIIQHPSDPSLALVPLTKGFFATIDVVDAAEVGRFNWYAQEMGGGERVYAMRRWRRRDGEPAQEFLLHRFIAELAGIDTSDEVDHRNLNTWDCRRRNLRSATKSQNMMNRRAQRNNRSGVKGVAWHRASSKWMARVTADKRTRYLGVFESLEEATRVTIEARRLIHGDFSRSN